MASRVMKPETIALMSQNAMGNIRVPALKTALPRSADFSFIADGRDQWSPGFLITVDQVPGKRSPGSLSWGGINNTYFWIDPSRGVAGDDHDAVPAVRRRQGAGGLRRIRARHLQSRQRRAVGERSKEVPRHLAGATPASILNRINATFAVITRVETRPE